MTTDELIAALIAAGMNPGLAATTAAIEELRIYGSQSIVYGLLLTRQKAQLLHAQVTAILDQARSTLITYDEAVSELEGLGVPKGEAMALAAAAVATVTTAKDIGVKKPIL